MPENNLTKIRVHGVDDDFVVLYLRHKEYQKTDLNLILLKKAYEIFDNRIKTDLIKTFKEYKELKISLSDFFNTNIITASCKRRNDEFTLKKVKFDQEKEVT